jgi:copper chaperone CopZ
MTCEHCRQAVTAEITAVDGVQTAVVDLATGLVTVTADRPVDRADIAAAVDEAGYRVAS